MHSPTLYTKILGTTNHVIKEKTEGLTHADSMLQLPFPGNCMNWILGHMLVYRMQCLGVIDGESKPDEGELALYGFGSEPMTDSNKAIPLETLLARLDDATEQINAALDKMPESRLEVILDEEQDVSVEQRLHFYLVFHEAYHAGQLEPLYELALANGGQ